MKMYKWTDASLPEATEYLIHWNNGFDEYYILTYFNNKYDMFEYEDEDRINFKLWMEQDNKPIEDEWDDEKRKMFIKCLFGVKTS